MCIITLWQFINFQTRQITMYPHYPDTSLTLWPSKSLFIFYYYNQCWLIINTVLWDSPEEIFQELTKISMTKLCLKITHMKLEPHLPRRNEFKNFPTKFHSLEPKGRTYLDEFTVSLHSPNCRLLRLCKGTVSGLWKMLEIPTDNVSPQSIVTRTCMPTIHGDRCNPNLYLDQPITNSWCQSISSSLPNAAYVHQWIGSALIQAMACHLFGAKPLPEPMLPCCQFDPKE